MPAELFLNYRKNKVVVFTPCPSAVGFVRYRNTTAMLNAEPGFDLG